MLVESVGGYNTGILGKGTMTVVKETVVTLAPCDIKAVLVVCETCGYEAPLRLDVFELGDNKYPDTMFDKCPTCETEWKKSNEVSAAMQLRRALVNFTGNGKPVDYTVRLAYVEKPKQLE